VTDPVRVDESLARRLVAAQLPRWADLPIVGVEPQGWDNRTFRLGEEMAVRLPSAEIYAAQIEKEFRWLPVLAPQLPLRIPEPLVMGTPGEGCPWPWSVYRWLEGETARPDRIEDLDELARTLGAFLHTLQRIDPSGGPPAGRQSFFRGASLATYDHQTRRAITALDGRVDAATASAVWETALATTWNEGAVWFHGDMSAGNLLVRDGRLDAVIDFGVCGIGDPACDLTIAWTLFDGSSRAAFRDALGVDDGTWARGRGWALWKALITLGGLPTNAIEVAQTPRTVDEVFADFEMRR
jgi:aminoglycoside phosphotransferase (APT) family kinase protein